jgi:hypothetical protein
VVRDQAAAAHTPALRGRLMMQKRPFMRRRVASEGCDVATRATWPEIVSQLVSLSMSRTPELLRGYETVRWSVRDCVARPQYRVPVAKGTRRCTRTPRPRHTTSC